MRHEGTFTGPGEGGRWSWGEVTEKGLAGVELWLNKHSKRGFICQDSLLQVPVTLPGRMMPPALSIYGSGFSNVAARKHWQGKAHSWAAAPVSKVLDSHSRF